MNRTILLFALTASAYAEPRWLRHAATVAACATQATDAWSTVGKRELNPMLATSAGHPNWPMMVGIKGAICAGAIIADRKAPRAATWMNLSTAGAFGFASARNLGVPKTKP